MSTVHDYIEKVVKEGDRRSNLSRVVCATTLKNCGLVDIVDNIVPVLRVPAEYYVVVHSASGNPETEDLSEYAKSMVENLMQQAMSARLTPLAFADVIDSNTGSEKIVRTVLDALVRRANYHGLAIINGETAILGNRISESIQANITGTMISIAKKDEADPISGPAASLTFSLDNDTYAMFDPEGKAVYVNSDGVGTKTEFYERAGKYGLAVHDFAAMNLDDLIKLGATAKVLSGVVETKGEIPFADIAQAAKDIQKEVGALVILQQEAVNARINGYAADRPSYNISGSAVSVIDEERLKNPLIPKPGDKIIAIRGHPNPRSNGITSKRKIMVENFGNEWHETEEGKKFLNYLASPSVILYPVFKELIDAGIATSVYHMSGGAYNGKFARPLAKLGLLGRLYDIFPPNEMDLRFLELSKANERAAYSQWPMGNDGFVTTRDSAGARAVIEKHGLEAIVAGIVEKVEGSPGVWIHSPLGNPKIKPIYFSGKDE